MKSIRTALIIVCVFLFLLIFFLTSSVDLALTVAVTVYLLFFYKKFIPVFIISVILFGLSILFDYYDLKFRFISDLTVDAYILLILGVLLYFRLKYDFLEIYLNINDKDTQLLYKEITPKIVISMILGALFFPIVEGPLAAAIGYIFFSVFIKKNNGKIAVFLAIVVLILTSIFLLFRNQDFSKSLGVYAYYFLIIGTLQEVINLIIKKKEEKHHKPEKDNKTEEDEPKLGLITVKPAYPKIPKWLFGGIAFAVSFGLVYLWLPKFSPLLQVLFEKKISPTVSPLVPTLSESPLVSPLPITNVSTDSAKLKILVQNGTEIKGLAASAAAKLKEAGFTDISTGNANHQDYAKWEVNLNKKDTELIDKIKNILELSELNSQEASIPAGIDMLIIAGSSK